MHYYVLHTIQIVKLDVTTKTKTVWYEKDCFPSEPVFVAAPDAEEEDQGIATFQHQMIHMYRFACMHVVFHHCICMQWCVHAF